MPIPIHNNDILECTLATRHESGQNGLMICHYQITDIGVGVALEGCAEAISERFSADLKALISVRARYEGVRLRIVHPTPSDVVFSVNGEGDGEVTGDCLPSYVSSLISLRTGIAGPSYRGRKYVPFPSETHNVLGGVPTDTYLTLLLTLSNSFLTPLIVDFGDEPAAIQPGLYRKNRTPRFVPWDHALVRHTWCHQKRRFDSVLETSVIITPVS